MKKQIIFIFLILALMGIAFYLIYTKYSPDTRTYYNVSIATESNRERVPTQLNIDGMILNTSYSYEQFKATGTITIKNINLESQKFYLEERQYNITEDTRIDFELNKPMTPEISSSEENGTINVTVESENFRDAKFCLKGSQNYIFIKAVIPEMEFVNLTDGSSFFEMESKEYSKGLSEGIYANYTLQNYFYEYNAELPEIEKINGYERCYNLGFSIKGVENIYVNYEEFGNPGENDYIEIMVSDSEGNSAVERIK